MNVSETRDVDFRCVVTDGKPCRNQKIVFIFLWFCSGNIRCKWNPYYRMDGLRNKDKHRLKFAFPGATFCENEYCRLLHLFVFSTFISGSWKLQRSRLQTIICQMQRRSGKKSHHCLHLTNITKALEEKTKEKNPAQTHLHKQFDITPIQLLSALFDPNCNMSQKPGPSTT